MEAVKAAIRDIDELQSGVQSGVQSEVQSEVRNAVVQFAEKMNKLMTLKVAKESVSKQVELLDAEVAWKGAIKRVYEQYHKRFDPHWSKEESYQCSLLAMLEFDRPEQLTATYIQQRCEDRHKNHIRTERKLNRWKYAKYKGGKLCKRMRTEEYELIDERKELMEYEMKHIEQLIEVLTEHNQKFGEIARLILIESYDHPKAYRTMGVSRQNFHKMKCSAARFLKERAERLQREAEMCELFGNIVESW